jgi:hypothetical protein
MVEIDEDVAAVWQTIFHEELWRWLTQAIVSFGLTDENIERFFARTDLTLQEWALKTILRNRVNRVEYWLMVLDELKTVKLVKEYDHGNLLFVAASQVLRQELFSRREKLETVFGFSETMPLIGEKYVLIGDALALHGFDNLFGFGLFHAWVVRALPD